MIFPYIDYRLLHNYNDNMTAMYDRIKAILINGVTICDRKYEFLAFSSSQLREHSCWMFASSDDGITAEYIRKWMGDFSDARPVAKLAARVSKIKYSQLYIVEIFYSFSWDNHSQQPLKALNLKAINSDKNPT